MITFILLGVFVAVAFAIWREGPWSGFIMLLNTLLAATLATAWYSPVVRWAQPKLESYTYMLDFVVLQGMFCLILLVLRETTDRLSRSRVRFRKPVELVAGPLIAVVTAWIMTCFTATTLHTAFVPRNFVQASPDTRLFFGLAPDRWWLSWMRGATAHGPFGGAKHAFDPDKDFIERYATRRKLLEAQKSLRVEIL